MTDRLERLEALVDTLAERVDRLEARGGAEPGSLDLTLLERLGSRKGPRFEGSRVRGALTYAGSIRIDEAPLVWQRELGAPGALEAPPTEVAALLAAAGHPDRIAILTALCVERVASADLAERLGLASPGRLYHHLDKLAAVGLVRQVERGTWEIAPEKVIPVLVLLGIAADLNPQGVIQAG
ncbi:MAG: helix-turn-helix domain-containing protein [Myxococcota bacterium]